MEDTITIVEHPQQNTLYIAESIPMWKFPSVMGKDYQRILECFQAQSITDHDTPYVRYIGIDWAELDQQSKWQMLIEVFTRKWNIQIGIPARGEFSGQGAVEKGSIPAGNYLQAMHLGPYKNVGQTYSKMAGWAREHEVALASESFELYLNDPTETAKEALETRVLIPLQASS